MTTTWKVVSNYSNYLGFKALSALNLLLAGNFTLQSYLAVGKGSESGPLLPTKELQNVHNSSRGREGLLHAWKLDAWAWQAPLRDNSRRSLAASVIESNHFVAEQGGRASVIDMSGHAVLEHVCRLLNEFAANEIQLGRELISLPLQINTFLGYLLVAFS